MLFFDNPIENSDRKPAHSRRHSAVPYTLRALIGVWLVRIAAPSVQVFDPFEYSTTPPFSNTTWVPHIRRGRKWVRFPNAGVRSSSIGRAVVAGFARIQMACITAWLLNSCESSYANPVRNLEGKRREETVTLRITADQSLPAWPIFSRMACVGQCRWGRCHREPRGLPAARRPSSRARWSAGLPVRRADRPA